MSVRMEWRLGTRSGQGERPDLISDAPPLEGTWSGREDGTSGARRERAERAAGPGSMAAIYFGALLVAAAAGFGLGRYSESRGALLRGVRDQLAVEALAWRDADSGLYAASLDPDAPPDWRAVQLSTFTERAPMVWTGRIVDLVPEGDLVLVEVELDWVDGNDLVKRYYRPVAGAWVWGPAPPRAPSGMAPIRRPAVGPDRP